MRDEESITKVCQKKTNKLPCHQDSLHYLQAFVAHVDCNLQQQPNDPMAAAGLS